MVHRGAPKQSPLGRAGQKSFEVVLESGDSQCHLREVVPAVVNLLYVGSDRSRVVDESLGDGGGVRQERNSNCHRILGIHGLKRAPFWHLKARSVRPFQTLEIQQ